MKKSLLLPVVLLLMAFFAGCSSNNSTPSTTGKGNLAISIGFPSLTKAYNPSTAIPTTSWNNNIKDLLMVLTDASNVIQYAIPVPLSSTPGIAATPQTFTNIPVGTYTVTIIANSQQSNIVTQGYPNGWNAATMVGQN